MSEGRWLPLSSLAASIGVSSAALRKAINKHPNDDGIVPWRGIQLCVRLASSRLGGGTAGLAYEVAKDSIPPRFFIASEAPISPVSEASESVPSGTPDLMATTALATPTASATPAPATLKPPPVDPPKLPSASDLRSPVICNRPETAWRRAVILPILCETDARSPERAARVVEIAATSIQYWRGGSYAVPQRTLREWIARYEAHGITGLMRRAPSNSGARRVHVSRAWDCAMRGAGIPEALLIEIVAKVRQRVRSEWRSGTPSWPTVQLNTMPTLVELTRAAGLDKPDAALRALCQVPRRFIDAERRYALVAMKEKDAARYASEVVPRVKRDRSHLLPSDWIAADVHHLDVLWRRPDGTDCTPKAVAWHDLATNRTRLDIFIMPKGEMIRREHVIQSFVAICTDPNWGVPSHVYGDNGGEYNWMELAEDIAKLKRSIDVRFSDTPDTDEASILRARPYNPQAKVIEGLFSTLERVAFAQLPGYIGGNRMRKKTANQGRAPLPYPGDETQLRQAIAGCVAYYHAKPQSGHLKGKSPDTRFAEFVAGGWRSTTLDPWELSVAFSRELIKPVRTGGAIRLDGKDYRTDALLSYVGRKVLARQPMFGDQDRLFIFTEHGAPIAIADLERVYRFGDPRGAGEQSRREKVLRTRLKTMAAEAPHADAEATMGAVVALHARPAQAATEGVIRFNPEFSEAARMAKEAPQRAEEMADRKSIRRAEKSAILARLAETAERKAG